MDFTISRQIETIAHRVRQFVDDEVIPVESELLRSGDDLSQDILHNLRAKAKAAKLWAPTMPKEWGGMGLNIQEIVPVFEAAGRSMLGPMAIHCAAPTKAICTCCTIGRTKRKPNVTLCRSQRRDLLRFFHDRTATGAPAATHA